MSCPYKPKLIFYAAVFYSPLATKWERGRGEV